MYTAFPPVKIYNGYGANDILISRWYGWISVIGKFENLDQPVYTE